MKRSGARSIMLATGPCRALATPETKKGPDVFDLPCPPGVHRVLRSNSDWTDMIARQLALLNDVDPGPQGLIRARFVFAGIAGSAAQRGKVDTEKLHRQLVETGRRTLGLRAPRRTT